jgi:hypothetical protein
MEGRRLARRLSGGLLAAVTVVAGLMVVVPGASATPALIPAAHPTIGPRTVGPLFPAHSAVHTCTGSVVDSPSGDLVITAAHCVAGPIGGWRFVPGYRNGTAPFGSWRVIGVAVTPSWLATRSQLGDVAVVKVASQRVRGRLRSIESVVGAERLGLAPAAGVTVRVPAYVLGTHDAARTCSSTVRYSGAFPTFVCGGYADGTSGAPWLVQTRQGTEVVGVIGGLHQGGCLSWISYSAPFGPAMARTVAHAARPRLPVVAPRRPSDGCPTGL